MNYRKSIASFIGGTLALTLLTNCVHLKSVSLTSIPEERSQVVKTNKEKFVFFLFNFDNDFVDSAVQDLKSQCPKGKVTGILTKDETVMYFLFFVWKMRLTAEGYCVERGAPTRSKASLDDSTSSNYLSQLSQGNLQ